MARLAEFRKSFVATDAITITRWREIVHTGNIREYINQGLQCFARQEITCVSESSPYCIECYRLCPVTLEACDGNQEVFEQLLENVSRLGDRDLVQDVLNESLAMVMRTHCLDRIKYLLDQGADANSPSPLGGTNVLGQICGDYDVTEENNINIAELLMKRGARDLSAAMCGAAYNYRVNLLKYLLDNGAPATGYPIIGPITRAGFNDQFRVPQILLDHGADPNYTGSMRHCAMLWAAFHGAENTVKLLLLYGANPDHTADLCLDANVPIHIACIRGYVAVVALLIRGFCDIQRLAKMLQRNYSRLLTTHAGTSFEGMQFTALEAVCLAPPKDSHMDIANLLLAAGAKQRPTELILYKDSFPSQDLYTRMQEYFSQPPTLMSLCRITIRQCLKGKGNHVIRQQLPLPTTLVSYVLMEQETEPFINHLEHFDIVQQTARNPQTETAS